MEQNQEQENKFLTVTIERPDEGLLNQSAIWLEQAKTFDITSTDIAINAGESLKKIKALGRHLEQKRTAITVPMNQALREANALFKPAKKRLKDAEKLLKGKILKYQAEQDRIAQEAQRKADEEARKERIKLEKAAALAEQAGMEDRAEDLREEIEVQEIETQKAPVVQSAAPKIEGVHTRTIWKAEVTDKLEFLKFVVEKRQDLVGLVEINQSALNAQARSLKDSLDLPGIKVAPEKRIAARS